MMIIFLYCFVPDGLDITSESYVSDGNKFRDHFKYNKDLQSLFLIKGQGEWLHFQFLKAVLLIRFDLILRRKPYESGELIFRPIYRHINTKIIVWRNQIETGREGEVQYLAIWLLPQSHIIVNFNRLKSI